MRYTSAMNKLLSNLGYEVEVLLRYYLDNYFETFEEPAFKNVSIRRLWFLLLIDGLCEEIRKEGDHNKIAKLQLRKLIIYNAKWFEHIALGLPETEIKTIKKAEENIKVLSEDKNYLSVTDRSGRVLKIEKDYIDWWCNSKDYYWENEFDISYPLYEITTAYNHEKIYKYYKNEKGVINEQS